MAALFFTLFSAVCIVAFAIILARLVFPLVPIRDRVDSVSLAPPEDAPLVKSIWRQWHDHPGKTGVLALGGGADAFATRMMLADAAVSSIDAQYYIWHGDLTGTLLLDALKRAADRGVRVRLLLDDHGTSGLDAELAALNAHKNAEVRLYNPFNLRRFKLLSYGFDFFRLNRRMHNKSFTVDGAATVMGGRNIGDEYFDTGPTALYVDLDVLAVGQIVPQVACDFDRYWAAPAVHPSGPILGRIPQGDPIGEKVARCRSDPQFEEYTALVSASEFVVALHKTELDLEWTDTVLVSDDPVKGERAVRRKDLLAMRLLKAVGQVERKFDGVTPYFVPGAEGVRAFRLLRGQGVQVRMLTNALEATDVLPVHAGYTKRRRDLLKAGVGVFELQRQSAINTPKEKTGPFGSSGASLHAKTFAVDGRRIFIGSFNFDPRSTMLNTEMGLLIDSTKMAGLLHGAFDRKLDGMAWQVTLEDHDLVWRNQEDGTMTKHEPGSNFPKRMALMVVGWLPVEWLL